MIGKSQRVKPRGQKLLKISRKKMFAEDMPEDFKVARLQSEFCTKDFVSSHEFSYEKCSEIFPENFEPFFCGSEKIPGKFPPNFPLNFLNFPAKNQKKIHRRASAGAQGGKISQKIEDITFTEFQNIYGYLRNLHGRLLSWKILPLSRFHYVASIGVPQRGQRNGDRPKMSDFV